MLIWLGEEEAANRMMRAVETVTERGISTKDLGGSSNTKEVTDAVCAELETVFDKVSKQA